MSVAGHRPERVAEEMRNEISLMLAGELKDPRLAVPLSVSVVRLSPDMRHARVYIRIQGESTEKEEALKGLTAAAGFVRHELVERLQLRRAPEIAFVLDESEEIGNRIEELLRQNKPPERP
jgi:ribosome-binding factor A